MTIDTKKIRELCARQPAMPDTQYLVAWWRATKEAVPELLDAVENNTCVRHAGQAHGAEAEELRSGIERLLTSVARVEGHDARIVLIDLRRGLQRLLDSIDARDSLAHLESRDEKLAAANAEIERLSKTTDLGIAVSDARRLRGERDEIRAMLIEVLRSAVPNRREHPTMFAAWERARALLDGTTTSRTGDAPAPERSGASCRPEAATEGTRRPSFYLKLDEAEKQARLVARLHVNEMTGEGHVSTDLARARALLALMPVVRAAVDLAVFPVNSESREAIASRVLLYVAVAALHEQLGRETPR